MKRFTFIAIVTMAFAITSCRSTKTGCDYGGMKKKFTADINVPAILLRVAEHKPGKAILVLKPTGMDTLYWHYTYTIAAWSNKPALPAIGTLYSIHIDSRDTCKPRTMYVTRLS